MLSWGLAVVLATGAVGARPTLYLAPHGTLGGVPVPDSGHFLVPLPDGAVPSRDWSVLHLNTSIEGDRYLVAAPVGRQRLLEYFQGSGSLSRIPGSERYAVFETTTPVVDWTNAVTELHLAEIHSKNETPHKRCAHVSLSPLPPAHERVLTKVRSAGPLKKPKQAGEKALLVGGVGSREAEEFLRKLTGDDELTIEGVAQKVQTRMSTTQDNVIAAEWISETLMAAGACNDVYQQEFLVSRQTTRNVVCVKHGITKKDEVVVMGAHFDSIPSSGAAPGAVDNGSGTVSVMVAAVALAKAVFERTIHFVLFSGEEQGLHGSREYVRDATSNNVVIPAAIIMDMTAYSSKYYGVTIEGDSRSDISAVMDNAEENLDFIKATSGLGTDLSQQKNYRSFGSDHVPFQQAGYPSILLIERDDTAYPGYHRTTDRVSYCNWGQLQDIARIAAAQVIDYAGLIE